MRYMVVIEKGEANGETSWGAYVPDLSGCIAAADTREEVEQLIKEAIVFHLEGMVLYGQPIPEPVSDAITVEVPIPQLSAIA